MRLIQTISEMIDDEIEGADNYATMAMKYKDEKPELARTLHLIATQEMEHIKLLHNAVVGIIEEYRNKLLTKIREVIGDASIDQNTLATELVIFADRICTDEETVRLRAHINNMKETLNQAQNIGRKLDFIAQEMNREANTILSKANDLEVSNTAINLKTEIEKIREQIQNIE